MNSYPPAIYTKSPRNFILVALIILSWGAVSADVFARIGETIEECEKRYGESITEDRKNGIIFRSYDFSGRRIIVAFSEGVSGCEVILFGPSHVGGHDDGKAFISEVVGFSSSILNKAYDFPTDISDGLQTLEKGEDGRSVTSSAEDEFVASKLKIWETLVRPMYGRTSEAPELYAVFTIFSQDLRSNLSSGDDGGFSEFIGVLIAKEYQRLKLGSHDVKGF